MVCVNFEVCVYFTHLHRRVFAQNIEIYLKFMKSTLNSWENVCI